MQSYKGTPLLDGCVTTYPAVSLLPVIWISTAAHLLTSAGTISAGPCFRSLTHVFLWPMQSW